MGTLIIFSFSFALGAIGKVIYKKYIGKNNDVKNDFREFIDLPMNASSLEKLSKLLYSKLRPIKESALEWDILINQIKARGINSMAELVPILVFTKEHANEELKNPFCKKGSRSIWDNITNYSSILIINYSICKYFSLNEFKEHREKNSILNYDLAYQHANDPINQANLEKVGEIIFPNNDKTRNYPMEWNDLINEIKLKNINSMAELIPILIVVKKERDMRSFLENYSLVVLIKCAIREYFMTDYFKNHRDSVQQAPVQQAPVQQAPVQQAPVQQAPVQQHIEVSETELVAKYGSLPIDQSTLEKVGEILYPIHCKIEHVNKNKLWDHLIKEIKDKEINSMAELIPILIATKSDANTECEKSFYNQSCRIVGRKLEKYPLSNFIRYSIQKYFASDEFKDHRDKQQSPVQQSPVVQVNELIEKYGSLPIEKSVLVNVAKSFYPIYKSKGNSLLRWNKLIKEVTYLGINSMHELIYILSCTKDEIHRDYKNSITTKHGIEIGKNIKECSLVGLVRYSIREFFFEEKFKAECDKRYKPTNKYINYKINSKNLQTISKEIYPNCKNFVIDTSDWDVIVDYVNKLGIESMAELILILETDANRLESCKSYNYNVQKLMLISLTYYSNNKLHFEKIFNRPINQQNLEKVGKLIFAKYNEMATEKEYWDHLINNIKQLKIESMAKLIDVLNITNYKSIEHYYKPEFYSIVGRINICLNYFLCNRFSIEKQIADSAEKQIADSAEKQIDKFINSEINAYNIKDVGKLIYGKNIEIRYDDKSWDDLIYLIRSSKIYSMSELISILNITKNYVLRTCVDKNDMLNLITLAIVDFSNNRLHYKIMKDQLSKTSEW